MSKVLIIGSGGREHALAWKFARSHRVNRVYAAPGNPGMEQVAEVTDISPMDFDKLVSFAKKDCINLTVVGPEAPLVAGIADRFIEEGLLVFGPTAKAAAIEGSKTLAKKLMKKYNIPTAEYEAFTDFEAAADYLKNRKPPYVIKADGLAAGKGVIVTKSYDEALAACKEMLVNKRFAEAGEVVLIEEFLDGREFSYMAFVNGENVYPMIPARDYQRAYDGDEGPNTGGMGAFAPVPDITGDLLFDAREKILKPIAKAMVKEGRPFTGVLYAGLIATEGGVKVIEFNARFGDPETGVLMPLLESDLYVVMQDLLSGKAPTITWSGGYTAGVVMASKGYPGKYETGIKIDGLEEIDENTLLFHSGTARGENGYVTNGGRVFLAVKKAGSIYAARESLYDEIRKIKCDNLFYRTDIGKQGSIQVMKSVL